MVPPGWARRFDSGGGASPDGDSQKNTDTNMKITITKDQAARICATIEEYNAREAARREYDSGSLFEWLRVEYGFRDDRILIIVDDLARANVLILSCAVWFRVTPAEKTAISAKEVLSSVLADSGVDVGNADFFGTATTSAIEFDILH